MRRLPLLGVALLLAVVPHTAAFNGHRVTAGPLTLTVEPVSTVTAHDQPADVAVTLASRAGVPLAVRLELTGLIDDCRAVGATRQTVTVPANGRATARFQVLFPDGCHSALYPVHIKATFDDGGKAATAHAIQIVTTEFPDSGRAVKEPAGPVAVPRRGAVALATVKRPVVHWAYLNGKERTMPPGWQGREPESSASFGWGRVARGETRAALHMHPPYVPGPGTVSVEYAVRLPDTRPLRLTFHTAIRDHAEKEPASDGVTFRVWADGRKLFERHSAAKTWTPGEVDLTPLAGRTVRLRLECHPGPKNDTTCDSAYWGDPTITAGPTPRVLTVAESAALVERARVAVATGVATGPDLLVFPLADGSRAASPRCRRPVRRRAGVRHRRAAGASPACRQRQRPASRTLAGTAVLRRIHGVTRGRRTGAADTPPAERRRDGRPDCRRPRRRAGAAAGRHLPAADHRPERRPGRPHRAACLLRPRVLRY
ncbi:MAG: hypothetical protein U0736_15885 [Gemmataceae bacterium]